MGVMGQSASFIHIIHYIAHVCKAKKQNTVPIQFLKGLQLIFTALKGVKLRLQHITRISMHLCGCVIYALV